MHVYEHYKSYAKWPQGTCSFTDDISSDTHNNIDSAQAVCTLLNRNGWGGNEKVFPDYTWITGWDVIEEKSEIPNLLNTRQLITSEINSKKKELNCLYDQKAELSKQIKTLRSIVAGA